MKFSEKQLADLKPIIVEKLEDISDADSNVLADYVLALLKSDAPDETIKKDAIANLQDFLSEHTTSFVDDLFARVAPHAPVSTRDLLAKTQPSTGLKAPAKRDTRSKKRSFNEANGNDPGYAHNGNPKLLKKAGKAGRDSRSKGRQPTEPTLPTKNSGPFRFHKPPTPPPGFPQIDRTNLFPSYTAFQSIFPNMPGMMGGRQPTQPARKQKCSMYHQKGVCAKGTGCPYSHSADPFLATPQEYDPKNALIDITGQSLQNRQGPVTRNLTMPQVAPQGDENPPTRPFWDSTITALVVERIPYENFDKEQIWAFFRQYGMIVDINLQEPLSKTQRPNHSAIVVYTSHSEATIAMNSPKAVFDNRFIKVSWAASSFVSESTARDRFEKSEDAYLEPEIDFEAIRAQQAIKQKEHEERREKLKEVIVQRAEVSRKAEEIRKKHDEEKAALFAKLAKKEGSSPPMEGTPTTAKALREHLAKLEAEARLRGIDPDAMSVMDHASAWSSSNTGFGSFRGGRGRFRGRGSYQDAAAHAQPWPSSSAVYDHGICAPAAMKLDNRPKSLLISSENVFDDVDGEGKLRSALMHVSPCEDIQAHAQGGVIVSFRERWQAEILMRKLLAEKMIQGVGSVEVKWIAMPVGSSKASTPRTMLEVESNGEDGEGDDVMSDIKGEGEELDRYDGLGDANLDVAGEDDWDRIT